jgi:hypothetical protein
MPSKSDKQARFMNIAAHSKKFAEQAGIPQSVAKEYNAADKRAGLIARVAAERKKKGGKR